MAEESAVPQVEGGTYQTDESYQTETTNVEAAPEQVILQVECDTSRVVALNVASISCTDGSGGVHGDGVCGSRRRGWDGDW